MKSPVDRIVAVLRRIPRGRVVTYGQVALLAGYPRAPRLVVAALNRTDGLPWHRVIGKHSATAGHISIKDPLGAKVQTSLLRKEGVKVDRAGRIDLERFGWTQHLLVRSDRKT